MDVLEEKTFSKNEVYLNKVLKYQNYPLKLVGTGALAAQQFPADIDCLTLIKKKPNTENIIKEFNKILSRIDFNKLFFVEFKIQNKKENKKGEFYDKNKDVEKYKVYNISQVADSLNRYYDENKIDLCKLDLIQFDNGKFKEVSCIYFFEAPSIDGNKFYDESKYSDKKQKKFMKNSKYASMSDLDRYYMFSVLEDQKHYYDEKKYYKSLKRFMLASKLSDPPNTNIIIAITNFFNSYTGYVYQINNNIMACMIYMDKFGVDNKVKYFIKYVLKLGDMNPSKLKDLSDAYSKIYNDEALRFYNYYKIPVGKLMEFQKKRL